MFIKRNQTKPILVNSVQIGGQDKVIIQSMTTTKTHQIDATLAQITALKLAGADLVRIAVLDDQDRNALAELVQKSPCPLIADIHFNFTYAIAAINAGFKKIRLNPGNITDPDKIQQIVQLAKEKNVSIRVGVNSGSIPLDILKQFGRTALAMVEAAKRYVNILEDLNFYDIVISLKASDPLMMVEANKLAAHTFRYPLHLGVTESGIGEDGIIKSTIGLAPVLMSGIGDTIRVSLTGDPVQEVYVAKKILNILGLRHDLVDIISCPTCGRLDYNMVQVVEEIKQFTQQMNFPLTISILGCVVNGIGEGQHADIGVAGSTKKGILFKKGKILKTVSEAEIIPEMKKLIQEMYEEFCQNQKK